MILSCHRQVCLPSWGRFQYRIARTPKSFQVQMINRSDGWAAHYIGNRSQRRGLCQDVIPGKVPNRVICYWHRSVEFIVRWWIIDLDGCASWFSKTVRTEQVQILSGRRAVGRRERAYSNIFCRIRAAGFGLEAPSNISQELLRRHGPLRKRRAETRAQYSGSWDAMRGGWGAVQGLAKGVLGEKMHDDPLLYDLAGI